jgi:hypothetical protein
MEYEIVMPVRHGHPRLKALIAGAKDVDGRDKPGHDVKY